MYNAGSNYLELKNGIVYSIDWAGLNIIDFNSVPSTLLSRQTYNQSGKKVTVRGGKAYCVGNNFLRIYDVTNPSAPIQLSNKTLGSYSANDIKVMGGFAYIPVSLSDSKVFIYDVSDPADVRKVSEITSFREEVVSLDVQGNRLYLCSDRNSIEPRLFMYDITNPSNPVLIQKFNNGGRPKHIVVDGSYAYVTDYYQGVFIYDISGDTFNKVGGWYRGSYRDPAGSWIRKSGDNLLLGGRWNWLVHLDVSDPTHPVKVADYENTNGGNLAVSADGKIASALGNTISLLDMEQIFTTEVGGIINVTSTPTGADILVDDVIIGTTDDAVRVDEGSHTLTIQLDGWDEWITPIYVDEGDNLFFNAILLPPTDNARIVLNSDPSPVNVYVDDELVGMTPMMVEVSPEYHSIVLKKVDYENWILAREFTIKEKLTEYAELSLLPEPPTATLINEFNESRCNWSATVGDKLFYATGDVLRCMDISDKANPVKIMDFAHSGNPMYGGQISSQKMIANDRAVFVAHGGSTIIIDADTLDVTNILGSSGAVDINGNILFVGASPNVTAYDVSTLNNPIKLGVFNLGTFWGSQSPEGSPYLFTNHYQTVGVYEIQYDPFNLVHMSQIVNPKGNVSNIDYKNGHLFCPNYPGGSFEIYDLSNPTNPVHVGEYVTDAYIIDRWNFVRCFKDNYVIMGLHDWSYQVVDISDIANPVKVGDYHYAEAVPGYTGGYPRSAFIQGDYLYCSLSYQGVDIVDMSNPTKPTNVCRIPTVGASFSSSMDKSTNLCYTLVDMGIIITDWNTVPASLVSHIYYSGRGSSIYREGTTLYACSSWAGLKVYDLTDIYNPVKLSEIYGQGYVNGMHKIGNVALLNMDYYDGTGGINFYDFTDVRNPVLIGTTGSLPNSLTGMTLKGDRMYVTMGRSGSREYLITFDISDFTNPVELSRISEADISDWRPGAPKIIGNYLYVSDYYHGFRIFDISSGIPVYMKLVDLTYQHSPKGSGFQVVGSYMYLPDGMAGGRHKFDITDPANPVYLEKIYTSGSIYPDGTVLETNDSSGLHLWDTGITPDILPKGVLTVLSNPVGANVFINNSGAGVTPTTFEVEPGTHIVTVRKDGYVDSVQEVVIGGSDLKTISVDLEGGVTPTTGVFNFSSTPAGADIFLNGESIGQFTPSSYVVEAGVYILKLRYAGYVDFVQEITVGVGESKDVNCVLELLPPTTGVLSVTSTPSDAILFVDGVEKAHTPCSITLEAGDYNLTISKAGYYDYTGVVSITVGETTPLEEVLTEIPPTPTKGRVNVTSIPLGASVIVDGVDTEAVTPVGVDLEFGQHDFEISLVGYATQHHVVEVVVNPQDLEVILEKIEEPEEEPSDSELIKWGALALALGYGLHKLIGRGGKMSKSGVNKLLGKL